MIEHTDEFIEVSAVIPCLNEEKTIGLCIEKALNAFQRLGIRGEVLIADNGSTDNSVALSRSLGARVVHCAVKGYGAALICGIDAAKGDIVVMADADDSYDWGAIGDFVGKVREGYDLVMGNRFKGGIEPGAMPILHKYLGNPVLSAAARLAFKTKVGDFHCGMRGFRKRAIQSLNLKSTGMEFATEMVANAARHQLRITEIPTTLFVDKRDRPPHLRSFRDGWRHLRFILTYAPDHLFLIPGLVLLGVGLVLLIALSRGPIYVMGAYFGIHFLALACLFTLVGYNVLWMGILAKCIMAQKFSILKTPMIRFFSDHFKLEIGLGLGVFLIAVGMAVDFYIFGRWITNLAGPMKETIHPAFTASTLIAVGVITLFSSFLLSLQNEFKRDDQPRDNQPWDNETSY